MSNVTAFDWKATLEALPPRQLCAFQEAVSKRLEELLPGVPSKHLLLQQMLSEMKVDAPEESICKSLATLLQTMSPGPITVKKPVHFIAFLKYLLQYSTPYYETVCAKLASDFTQRRKG